MDECQMWDSFMALLAVPPAPQVQAHLEACWECAEEFALLQQQRQPLVAEVAVAYGDATGVSLLLSGGPLPLLGVYLPHTAVVDALPADFPLPLVEVPWPPEGTFAHPQFYVGMRIEQVQGRVRVRGQRRQQGRFIVVTTPERELFLPMGATVQGLATVTEACHLVVVHQDAQGHLQLLRPTVEQPDTAQPADTTAVTLLIQGRHGERQQLTLVVTPERVLPGRLPFADAEKLAECCREVLAYVRTYPIDQWALVPLRYTVVDRQRVEQERTLSLAALEAQCLKELPDEADAAKTACAEVCDRLLSCPAAAWDSALFELFRAITQRFVWHVVMRVRQTKDETQVATQTAVRDVVDVVYGEFFKTAQRPEFRDKFLRTCHVPGDRPFTCFSYLALLEYLRTIALVHAFPEERERERAARKAALPALGRWLPFLAEEVRTALHAWACAHVLRAETWQQEVLAGHLAGESPSEMLQRRAALRQRFYDRPKAQAEKTVHNQRDSVVWQMYKGVMQRGPDVLQAALQHLLATRGPSSA